MKEYIIKQEEEMAIEITLEFNDFKKEQKLIANFIADKLKIELSLAQAYVEAFIDDGFEIGVKRDGYIIFVNRNTLFLGHYKMRPYITEK